jgi:hypothetical protein
MVRAVGTAPQCRKPLRLSELRSTLSRTPRYEASNVGAPIVAGFAQRTALSSPETDSVGHSFDLLYFGFRTFHIGNCFVLKIRSQGGSDERD